MNIEPAYLAACIAELEALSKLIDQERTAILADDLAALAAFSSAKSAGMQALAGKLMSFNRSTALAAIPILPEAQSSAAQYRAVKLLRENFEHNRNNGVMLNLRAARKNVRLAALLELNPSACAYGRSGAAAQAYSPRRIARA